MPKMEAASLTIKISLAQIVDTGNIREKAKYSPNEKGEWPQDVIDLAMSIKTMGLLQPINVKLSGEKDGVKMYEITAGNRRRAAHEYLVSLGEDFTQIDAKVITGNKLAIQLVENIQREDLTAQEREAAIFQLTETMKQKEIAAQLSKTPAYISVNVSAYKIREKGIKAGIDLSAVETSTLAEFLSVPDNEIVSLLEKLKEAGGTRAAASALAARFKKGKERPPEPPAAPVKPSNIEPPGKNDIPDPLGGRNKPPEPTPPVKPLKPGAKPPPDIEPITAEHREIDLNIVLTVIYDYIKDAEKQIAGQTPAEKNKWGGVTKIEAAKDILALIHKAIDNA
jgi:ParB/RepB/Spo0J family partition protein